MPDAYSPILLAALIAGGLAMALKIVAVVRSYEESARAESLRRSTLVLGAAGVGLALLALGWHLLAGHRPGTAQAMTAVEFLEAHPAPLLALLLGGTAYVIGGGSPRGRD